jgi:hypothetical protein
MVKERCMNEKERQDLDIFKAKQGRRTTAGETRWGVLDDENLALSLSTPQHYFFRSARGCPNTVYAVETISCFGQCPSVDASHTNGPTTAGWDFGMLSVNISDFPSKPQYSSTC